MGVLGGYLYWKVILEFWFGHPKCHFRYPPKRPKWVILGFFGYFGGIENGTSGAQIKILKSLFNTNTPLKPPFSRFGNNFRPRKSDFWPFYWFWSFSHWNSHWSRKIFRTAEGKVVHQKQNLFWKSETKWNNLKPCKSWNSKFHQNKNHLNITFHKFSRHVNCTWLSFQFQSRLPFKEQFILVGVGAPQWGWCCWWTSRSRKGCSQI